MRVVEIIKNMWKLIKKNKIYILAPALIIMALIALIVFTFTPAAVTTFIYAGL